MKLTFAKSKMNSTMNLNLGFLKTMNVNLNLKIKNKMNGSHPAY